MTKRIRRLPSPALVIAIIALMAAVGGGTYAIAISGQKTKKIAKRVANKQITKRAGNLSVSHASTANRAMTAGHASTADSATNADNATDAASADIAKSVAAPEAWREVGAGSTTGDACADPANTAVFCSVPAPSGGDPWRNFGPPHPTTAFYKDQLGIVHLKGVVRAPSVLPAGVASLSSTPQRFRLFRLPPAYRPQTQRIFASVGAATYNLGGSPTEQEASGRLDVQPDGLVVLEVDCAGDASDCSANGPYMTLDGMSFRPDG